MGMWLPAEQGLSGRVSQRLGVGQGSPGRSQKPTFLPFGLALWAGVDLLASLSFAFKAVTETGIKTKEKGRP